MRMGVSGDEEGIEAGVSGTHHMGGTSHPSLPPPAHRKASLAEIESPLIVEVSKFTFCQLFPTSA